MWSTAQDVADYLTKGGCGSESEGEDAGDSRVMLERDMGRGNLAARQSRVKLQEVISLDAGTWTPAQMGMGAIWQWRGPSTLHALHCKIGHAWSWKQCKLRRGSGAIVSSLLGLSKAG